MADPQTTLHYAPNANLATGTYAPGADGFNLADISSFDQVSELPAGVQGLVYLGYTDGNTPTFQAMIQPFIGNGQIYGFYLADDPGPTVSAANLKAELDYIHSVDGSAKTFITLENNGTPTSPSYSFNPANTGIDLFGLDPYPIRPQFSGGADYSVIGDAVNAATAAGIPQAALVPVYQAFGATSGAYSSWTLPTAAQEQIILSTWGQYTPTPAFDYAYSWGTQQGDTALSDDPALQAVFAAHNAGTGTPPPDVLTPQATTISATAGQSFSATVATFTDSNTSISPSELAATISWGDGTTNTAGVVTGSNGSFAVDRIAHLFDGRGRRSGSDLDRGPSRDGNGDSEQHRECISISTADRHHHDGHRSKRYHCKCSGDHVRLLQDHRRCGRCFTIRRLRRGCRVVYQYHIRDAAAWLWCGEHALHKPSRTCRHRWLGDRYHHRKFWNQHVHRRCRYARRDGRLGKELVRLPRRRWSAQDRGLFAEA